MLVALSVEIDMVKQCPLCAAWVSSDAFLKFTCARPTQSMQLLKINQRSSKGLIIQWYRPLCPISKIQRLHAQATQHRSWL